jgi:hypothetical protein
MSDLPYRSRRARNGHRFEGHARARCGGQCSVRIGRARRTMAWTQPAGLCRELGHCCGLGEPAVMGGAGPGVSPARSTAYGGREGGHSGAPLTTTMSVPRCSTCCDPSADRRGSASEESRNHLKSSPESPATGRASASVAKDARIADRAGRSRRRYPPIARKQRVGPLLRYHGQVGGSGDGRSPLSGFSRERHTIRA